MQMFKIKKGFTLVEIMIAISILALVGIGAMNFFQSTTRSFYQGQLKYIADSETQILIEYVKRDLAMACRLESDAKYLTESIIKTEDNGEKKTWSFEKFDEYIDGVPKVKQVKYTHDANLKRVTREYEGRNPKHWDDIETFYVNYYGLLPHHRYFYNIQVEVKVGDDAGPRKSEIFRVQTSVESKYENHLVNFPGWLKNPNSITSK